MPKLKEWELEERYAQMLDETYGDANNLISVCGNRYEPSRLLKAVDPAGYRTSMHNYADYLLRDGYEIEGY